MNLTRREVLKGISATAAASTMVSSALPSLAPVAGERAGSIPWPKTTCPVIDSLRPVIENSVDVHAHYDKIGEIAGWMAYEELAMPHLTVPHGLHKTPELAMDFVMVGNTIDTAFTDFKTHVKFQIDYNGERLSDSDAMFGCIKRAMDQSIPILDGKFLATLSRADMAKIFSGNIEMPMLDEKLELFHQVGGVLASKYDGRFSNFIHSCSSRLYDKGNGLVERLAAEFPRYNDVSEYVGKSIPVLELRLFESKTSRR
jgi:hypothetical protein